MSRRPTHHNAQSQEEASEWLIVLREAAELPLAEREAFDEWLRRSPEHVEAFLQVSAFWEDARAFQRPSDEAMQVIVARATAERNIVPLERRVPAADRLPAVTSDRATHQATALARSTEQRWRLTLASAASLLLVLGLGLSSWLSRHQGPSYATEVGEQRSLVLEDGSTVQLNSRSRLRVAFSAATRTVELLEGQALFHVAKNPARPFIVYSGSTHVRAVGTEFDVYKKSSGTVVTVVEGRVAVLAHAAAAAPDTTPPVSGVAAGAEKLNATTGAVTSAMVASTANADAPTPGKGTGAARTRRSGPAGATVVTAPTVVAAPGEVLLNAGEQLVVALRSTSAPAVRLTANPQAAIAWTNHQLIFESTPLRDVVEEFNRYNRQQLVIRDASLNEFHINGTFPSNDATRMIEFLRQRFDVSMTHSGDTVEIWRREPPMAPAVVPSRA